MNKTSQVIPPTPPLFYRNLQRAQCQALNQNYETQVRVALSEECREELHWWMSDITDKDSAFDILNVKI